MESTTRNARIAGLFYLGLMTAPLRLIYIPSQLFVKDDATATANNIAANEMLFRLGIVSDLLTATMAIFLTLALYRLFQGVNRDLARLMVILGSLMVTPIYFLNTLNDVAALTLVRGADFLAVFDKPQRDALAMLFLRLHHAGIQVNQIFWGLWLFPFGLLTFRSRFFPRFLGIWLILNGIGYVAVSLTGLLLPEREAMIASIVAPALVGELVVMLWFLIFGAKAVNPPQSPSADAVP